METPRFAALIRSLSGTTSRRGMFAGLSGGLVAAGSFAVFDESDARKNGQRKKRRKNRKQKNAPKVRADATCPGSEDFALGSATGEDRMAQTFTAQASGPLVKAQLSIGKEPDSDGAFVVRLLPVDDSGSPIEEVLAEATVANVAVPDLGGFIDFPFAYPFSVVAGVEYALALTRPGGDEFLWMGQSGSPCGGLSFYSGDQTKPFAANASDFDQTFTTFVKS